MFISGKIIFANNRRMFVIEIEPPTCRLHNVSDVNDSDPYVINSRENDNL